MTFSEHNIWTQAARYATAYISSGSAVAWKTPSATDSAASCTYVICVRTGSSSGKPWVPGIPAIADRIHNLARFRWLRRVIKEYCPGVGKKEWSLFELWKTISMKSRRLLKDRASKCIDLICQVTFLLTHSTFEFKRFCSILDYTRLWYRAVI